ncbi:preprotein translocase subunit YajC [Chitinimonas sp.]|uniref:preprotein translocase subunit YajC n=1 Tax=Chitinimonas sp. TaxID=1934313 RepID=UPI0035B4D72B
MLISPAYAAAAPAQPAGFDLMSFLPMVVIFVLFYFLMIRPQQKRMKEQKAMLDAITKGDEVISNGGVLGRVTKAGEQYLTIEIADGVEIVLQRAAVAAKLEKGTIKAQR